MGRWIASWLIIATAVFVGVSSRADRQAAIEVGFAEADITPKLDGKPVYIAGFGHNRRARAVHDPLRVRAVVLRHGGVKIALAAVDVVGFFHANVERIRQALAGFRYVLVCSTHNHEGPDTLGLWGPGVFTRGTDPDYLRLVENKVVRAVLDADSRAARVVARIGKRRAPELLHDAREPYIKHDELVVVEFSEPDQERPTGVIVQWNCHPETLGSGNTLVSADFVGYTVKEVSDRYHCPVLYLNGTVGGLMTSLNLDVRSEDGRLLADGTYEKTERYGKLVGRLAQEALGHAQPVELVPFQVRDRIVFLPMTNARYELARQLGVLEREAYVWSGDPYHAEPVPSRGRAKALAVRSELAWLRLGALDIAAIPGEIYPELVLDRVQDPPDPGSDFPDAPVEPAIYRQLRGPHRMIVGLANDEIGYIIPKRQWDEKPPYCYGRKEAQYGEINSLGPDTAPVLCEAFRELTRASK
jgi:hypothetical protein